MNERIWVLTGKKKSGEITEEESLELEKLLRSDAAAGFTSEVVDRIWDTPMHTVGIGPDQEKIWGRIEEETQQEVVKSTSWFKRYRVAAGIAILLLGTAAIFIKKDPAQRAGDSMHEVFTRPGTRSSIVLPDGTKVWMNAGTRLSYARDFEKAAVREVNLSGEAFFDVVHDASHPFVIHTAQFDIRDLGTRFNVKAYPQDKVMESTLISGAIEIIFTADPQRKILLKPEEKIVIPVNSVLAEAPVYTIHKVKKDTTGEVPETLWMQDKLVFDNMSFEMIALQMENWYDVKIHFKDSIVKQLRFSGQISKEPVEKALDIMQYAREFSYEIKGKEIWVSMQ